MIRLLVVGEILGDLLPPTSVSAGTVHGEMGRFRLLLRSRTGVVRLLENGEEGAQGRRAIGLGKEGKGRGRREEEKREDTPDR